jgi:hypothetical protein
MKAIEGYRPWDPEEAGGLFLAYLKENGYSTLLEGKTPCQINRFLQDLQRVPFTAAELGCQVSGFQTDEDRALYWDISRSDKDIGFIFRGWDDPGFGVGECVLVKAAAMPIFMAQEGVISDFLATNGFCMTMEELAGGECSLGLTTTVYAAGFNTGTLNAVLGTLEECSATVKSLVGVES